MTQQIAKKYIENYFKKTSSDFYSHGIYCEKITKEILKGLLEFDFFDKETKDFINNYSKLLYLASIIHDIGVLIPGDKPHNKKGAKFILKNKIPNLTDEENLIVSNLIRFHRGKNPKDKNKLFNMLKEDFKPIVRLFSGILRVADALDYNHYEICENISLKDDKENKVLTIFLDCDMKNNIGFNLIFKKKSKLLRKILDRKIKLSVF